MSPVPGEHLGSYEILAAIGEGGMGEVYGAYDPHLDRKVAIKVLPADAVGGADARSRLLREARAAAALSHANLCTIHEVGEADGRPFIVMELLDGETLDALIPPGGLPAADVMRYARALMDGLAHAHDRGIIHRDLKPSNIRVTSQGVDLERGSISPIATRGNLPIWTPDGRRVIYAQGGNGLFAVRADGTGAPENLVRDIFAHPHSVSPDSLTVFYTVTPSRDPKARTSIAMLSLAGGPAAAPTAPWTVTTTGSERGAQISPDGKWIAYVSEESGKAQVYLRAFPGPAGGVAVSIDGGQEAHWSRNPQALFFRNPETNQLMTTDLPSPGANTPGPPRVVATLSTQLWDIAPDGSRVLFSQNPDAGADLGGVQVVINWLEELKQRVSVH